MSLAGLGDKERAIQFAAAVSAEWGRMGVDIQVRFWDALIDRYVGTAKRSLAVKDAEQAWNKGLRIPFEEAVALALA
jgi:hypothetical protein